MRWMAMVLLAMLLAAPTAKAATAAETTMLVAMETSLAIDFMQTRQIHLHRDFAGYSDQHEINAILGRNPSGAAIGGYFATSMVLTGAVWYFVPKSRLLLPSLVLLFEIPTVTVNAAHGLGLGFRF